jgi:hypothetical protein
MGVQFFIVFALSIVFVSMGVTGWRDFVSVTWNERLQFSENSQFSDDLDRKIIPEGLQQEFAKNGLSLSENVTVSVEDKGSQWRITDFAKSLCKVDSKLQIDLDNRTISQDLRQEFENNGITLPQNATVSIEETGSRWLITNKARAYTVSKAEDELDIYSGDAEVYTIRQEKDQLNIYNGHLPHLGFEANYFAIFQCFLGFLLFLISLYLMGFFLYLEERESGRIMKNIRSFVKLREFLERAQK